MAQSLRVNSYIKKKKSALEPECGQLPWCTQLHGGGWTLNKIRVLLEAESSERSRWRKEGMWWLNEACEECLNTGGHLYLDESLTWEVRVTCAEQGERLLAGRGRWACSDPLQKLHLHQQGQSSSGRTLGASSMWAAQDLGKTKKILGIRNLLIHWNIAYQMALVPSPFSLTITSSYLPWSFFFHAENISPSWTSGAFLYWRYEPPFFQTICSCLDL